MTFTSCTPGMTPVARSTVTFGIKKVTEALVKGTFNRVNSTLEPYTTAFKDFPVYEVVTPFSAVTQSVPV